MQPVQPVYAVVQATDSSVCQGPCVDLSFFCFSLLLQVKRLPGSPAETPPWQPAQDPDWGPLCPKTAAEQRRLRQQKEVERQQRLEQRPSRASSKHACASRRRRRSCPRAV